MEDALLYYDFPGEPWRRTRTGDPLDRIVRATRRKIRVVGAFSDGQSVLNLVAARSRRTPRIK